MPKQTRPSKSQSNVLQDAQQVHKDLTKALPRIEKENRATKKKGGVNAAFAKKLGAALKAFAAANKAQGVEASAARRATATEQAARTALAKELQAIRSDVVEIGADDAAQVDFGRGRKITDKTTGELLTAADDFASAYEAHAAAVADAGVNAARMKKVATLRAALADADTSQRSGQNTKSSASSGKKTELKAIRAMVGTARKRLSRLGAPSKDRSARRKTTPRAPKDGAAKPKS